MGSVGRAKTASSTVETLELPVEEETGDDFIDRVEYDKDREYHKFGDNPRTGWRYEGDGAETVAWFKEHSNYDEVIKSLTREERRAWDDEWVPGTYMTGELYRPWDELSDSAKHDLKIFDKTLDQATLDEGIIVRRRSTTEFLFGERFGRDELSADKFKEMRGTIITADAPMSTGAAAHGLKISSSGAHKPVEYVIHIPGGTKGAGMWIGDERINSGFGAEQREFVVNRDTAFAVGRTIVGKDPIDHDDVYQVHLYYVGRKKHKYS